MVTAVECVQNFRHLRALVIGDAMLDTYLEGTASRLCSEGPVPVVSKIAEYRLPGGAANTAVNVRALEAEVIFLSVIGTDIAGTMLRAALCERGVSDQWLIARESVRTLHKLRILADGQYVVRFDEGEDDDTTFAACEKQLLASLELVYPLCDVVIVSDYRYGVLSDQIIACLASLQASNPKVFLIDSKALHRFQHVQATVVTPNELEARLFIGNVSSPSDRQSIGTDVSHPGSSIAGATTDAMNRSLRNEKLHEVEKDIGEIERIGRMLLAKLATEYVAVTLAEHGVLLVHRHEPPLYLPAHPVAEAHDVGAGDSFAAALALALAAGADIAEAGRIGIDAASIAVTRRWTAQVQQQELLQRVSLREYAAATRVLLASAREDASTSLAMLQAQLEREREMGHTLVFTNGVFDILHAGHVQFLKQAKALGDMLIVGINSDSSTRRLKGQGRPINSERDRMALVAALDVVDAVVLFDEDTPTELIRLLRPHLHVKGGDYADEALPEAEVVRAGGGQVVILPLVGRVSTSSVIERIAHLHSGAKRGA